MAATTSHRYTKVETVNIPPLSSTRKLSVNTQKSTRPPIPHRNSAISIPSAEVILEHPGTGRRFSEGIQVANVTPPNSTPPGTDPGRHFHPRSPFLLYRSSSGLISPLSHAFLATALLIANVSQVRNFLNTHRDEHSFWDYVIWGLCFGISLQILAAVLLILSYIFYLKCGEHREVVTQFRRTPSKCFKLARGLESVYLILAFLIMALNIFTALFIEKDDFMLDKDGDLNLQTLFYNTVPTTVSPVTHELTTVLAGFPESYWNAFTLGTDETSTGIPATISVNNDRDK